MMKQSLSIIVLTLSIIFPLYGQNPVKIKIDTKIVPKNIKRNGSATLNLNINIPPHFHISDASSGLLRVLPDTIKGIQFRNPVFPSPIKEKYGLIYRGKIEIRLPFVINAQAIHGKKQIHVRVITQPCDERDETCYPPQTQSIEASFFVSDEATDDVSSLPRYGGIADKLTLALESGSILVFFLIFLGGVLTSFTPCVYPMIPITIAIIGAQAGGTKLKGFILSLFYVLGIATTFSVLGVIAAKTGSLFGSYAQHPILQILIATVFFLMGLSMLGVFILQVPSAISSRLNIKKKKGFLGAFITGLVTGLVVSPCVGPLLIVILTWIAKTGSVFFGFSLMFSFALGIGVLFVILGTFSGILRNLPKSGGWTYHIEKGFGILLIILAIVFLKPVLSLLVYQGIWGVFFILLGTFLGAFSPLTPESKISQKIGKALGYLSILIGSFLLFFSFYQHYHAKVGYTPEPAREISTEKFWVLSEKEGFPIARSEQKPILIDFFAEWCAACHELDEKTWSDPSIQNELERFVPIRLDLSKNNASARQIYQKYRIQGLPTVILLNRSGEEVHRFTGFQPPYKVLEILKDF